MVQIFENKIVKISFLWIAILSVTAYTSFSQKHADMPLAADPKNSLEYEWSQKQVYESKQLTGNENLDGWQHKGFGSMSLTHDKYYKGQSSLLLTSPTKGNSSTMNGPQNDQGRPWGGSNAVYSVAGEDWSGWNRISFWVYPDLPGFRVVSLALIFHNDGKVKVPDSYRDGLHFQILENHKWNKVYWEIEHLARDKVTAIEFSYRLQGNEPEATKEVKYYIDEVFLEKVKPDHYEGWNVAPGHIAYNHLGYVAGMPKTALASNLSAKEFALVNSLTGKTVINKPIVFKKTDIGNFQVIDFSEVDNEGTYFLKVGSLSTKPFRISSFGAIYNSTVDKTINHFYTQRCGFEVPGVHSVCHGDWTSVHKDKTIIVNGGWHDAGDLSQGLINTSEAAYAMLSLAEKLQQTDPSVSSRLLEEAKWGVDWMLKTRFEDGFRTRWSTMDFWTDGVIGTIDDASSKAENDPYANILSAKTEAKAAMMFKKSNPIFANYALECAENDWGFATDTPINAKAELAGAAINTSLELYQATSNLKYKNAAFSYADSLLKCQQQENLSDDIPLKGFFYTNSSRKNILHYLHRGHEQDMVVGLVKLCQSFPDHANFGKWKNALGLYAEYYKQISKYTDPYFMIPSGIYDLEAANDTVIYNQIKGGFRLNDRYYMKCFPAWKDFRGNSGTILSQAKGLAAIADYLNDKDLLIISYKQLDWHLGLNPFNQSLMYGEGYRFAAQYSAMSGNLVGGLPVGIQSRYHYDKPYWPANNAYNYKEIWVHPSSRWLWIMSDFYNTNRKLKFNL